MTNDRVYVLVEIEDDPEAHIDWAAELRESLHLVDRDRVRAADVTSMMRLERWKLSGVTQDLMEELS